MKCNIINMHLHKHLFITAFFFMHILMSHANFITVKKDGTGNYAHIHTALYYAFSGDTILVYPGTYYENLNTEKDIFLVSLNWTTGDSTYISQTIIDGRGIGTCLEASYNDFTLWGFTIQNGKTGDENTYGGGVHLVFSNATIKNCIVQNSEAKYGGGGVSCYEGVLNISGTTIRNNKSMSGGGLYCSHCELHMDTINKCNIYCNHGYSHGKACDISFHYLSNAAKIVVDTFTVLFPDEFFISPINDSILEIEHGYIEQVSKDVYVDPLGDNNSSGLSPDQPLKNLWYANAKILTDSIPYTIHLAEGIYSPSAIDERYPFSTREYIHYSGAGKNISFLDADSLTPVIYSWYYRDSLVLKDLTICNGMGSQTSTGHIIAGLGEIYGIEYCIFENVSFTNGNSMHGSGLRMGVSHLYCNNVDFHDNYKGRALILFQGNNDEITPTAIFRNCRFMRNTRYMGAIGYGGALYHSSDEDGANRCKIQLISCEFTENNGRPTVSSYGKNNIEIVNCTFGDNENTALYLYWDNTVQIYNSIFWNDDNYNIHIHHKSSSSGPDIEIYNSLFKDNVQSILSDDTLVNIYYDSTTCFSLYPWWAYSGPFPYYLQSISYCIDAGTQDLPQTIDLPEYDIAGSPRIYGNTIDIGAYEYISPVSRNEHEDAENQDVVIYPNPATNRINCQLSTVNFQSFDKLRTSCEIWIYDMFAGIADVIEVPKGQQEIQIDVSDYTPGIYIAVVKTEKEILGKEKFIKQ